ncbi:MAG: endonuclease/exonuclease/phosphatase family protein [Firmicutes bacterium]|nr:endonuclease/exonuclease/phosphatase family protein [Bacillota bacterium]
MKYFTKKLVNFFVATAVMLGTLGIGSSATATAATIKVMTYNIHSGIGTDGVLNLDRIASVIQAENPDIVALNEVDKNTTRSGMVDQAQYLANKLGMYYVFGKSTNMFGGEYGNAVLSKTPISSYTVHNLTSVGEQRTCLEVQTQVNGTTINFFVTHLGLDSNERITQVDEIKQLVANRTGPKIVVGTFQDSPTGTPVQSMLYDFRDAFAVAGTSSGFTNANPNVTVRNSYIFIGKNYATNITNCTVPSTTSARTGSTHRPVVSIVNW